MRTVNRLWNWFDDITGLSAILVPLLEHPVPRARRASWLYVLGSATLIAFLIQVVTGIALASGYVASSGQAYDTLVFIVGSHLYLVVHNGTWSPCPKKFVANKSNSNGSDLGDESLVVTAFVDGELESTKFAVRRRAVGGLA